VKLSRMSRWIVNGQPMDLSSPMNFLECSRLSLLASGVTDGILVFYHELGKTNEIRDAVVELIPIDDSSRFLEITKGRVAAAIMVAA
jgi:hypothetical protein